jgi:hypothetical protein
MSTNAEAIVAEGDTAQSKNGMRRFLGDLAQPVTCLGIGMLAFLYCALAYLLIADRNNAESDAERRGGQSRPRRGSILFAYLHERRRQPSVPEEIILAERLDF